MYVQTSNGYRYHPQPRRQLHGHDVDAASNPQQHVGRAQVVCAADGVRTMRSFEFESPSGNRMFAMIDVAEGADGKSAAIAKIFNFDESAFICAVVYRPGQGYALVKATGPGIEVSFTTLETVRDFIKECMT